jgi:hypothetical protein
MEGIALTVMTLKKGTLVAQICALFSFSNFPLPFLFIQNAIFEGFREKLNKTGNR